MPMLYLVKPFGGENWLCLKDPDDIQTFFEKLTAGDEFMLRVHEVSDEEFEGLEDFGGFDAGAVDEEVVEEEPEPEPAPEAPPEPPQE